MDRKELIEVARRITRIQKQWGNETCADCHAAGPQWASQLRQTNKEVLGVLVCDDCALVHHFYVGKKRCFIKYLRYVHEWKHEELDVIEFSGNCFVNRVYEANLSPCTRRYYHSDDIPIDEQEERQEEFIKRKYKRRQFLDPQAKQRALKKVHDRLVLKKAKTIAVEQEKLQRAASEMELQDIECGMKPRLHASTGDLMSSLRGTQGEVKTLHRFGKAMRSTEKSMKSLTNSVWSSIKNLNASNSSLNLSDLPRGSSGGEGLKRLQKGLSTSLRNIKGEAKSSAKSITFVDIHMLRLEGAEIDDPLQKGSSDDDEVSLDLSFTESLTMADTICSVSLACKVTGTNADSWRSEEDLMQWLNVTSSLPQLEVPNLLVDPNSDESRTSHYQDESQQATNSKSRRRRRSTSTTDRRAGRSRSVSKPSGRTRSLSSRGLRQAVNPPNPEESSSSLSTRGLRTNVQREPVPPRSSEVRRGKRSGRKTPTEKSNAAGTRRRTESVEKREKRAPNDGNRNRRNTASQSDKPGLLMGDAEVLVDKTKKRNSTPPGRRKRSSSVAGNREGRTRSHSIQGHWSCSVFVQQGAAPGH